MLIRIKNAERAGQASVLIPYSKFKHEIAKALERAGWLGGVERKGKRVRKSLEVHLSGGKSVIRNVRLISKPSRRLYAPFRKIPRSGRGGIVIVTTPKGVLTDREARKEKTGGQLIAEVW